MKPPAPETTSICTGLASAVGAPVLRSTLTCPSCGAATEETMPTDACLFFWDCPACGTLVRPKRGDCCVFCSYGTTPCPPVQLKGRGTGCC